MKLKSLYNGELGNKYGLFELKRKRKKKNGKIKTRHNIDTSDPKINNEVLWSSAGVSEPYKPKVAKYMGFGRPPMGS